MSQDSFANERYVSWLTVQLSLKYAKEGLEPSTEDRVEKFHNKLKSKLASPGPSSSSAPPVPPPGPSDPPVPPPGPSSNSAPPVPPPGPSDPPVPPPGPSDPPVPPPGPSDPPVPPPGPSDPPVPPPGPSDPPVPPPGPSDPPVPPPGPSDPPVPPPGPSDPPVPPPGPSDPPVPPPGPSDPPVPPPGHSDRPVPPPGPSDPPVPPPGPSDPPVPPPGLFDPPVPPPGLFDPPVPPPGPSDPPVPPPGPSPPPVPPPGPSDPPVPPPGPSPPPVPVLCNACAKQDLKKQWGKQAFSCVSGICDGWLGLLQNEHVVFLTSQSAPKVEWSNFDVSRLPVDAWECAKVYLPHGSQKVKCAGDADMAAILTLYLNCHHFFAAVHDVNLCRKVKDVRNKLFHTGNMEIDKAQMQSEVAIIKKLLNDAAFVADPSCQEAVAKIDNLLVGKLELSLNKELELQVLNGHIKSLAERTDQMSEDLVDLADKVQLLDQVEREVNSTATEVTSLKDQQLEAIKDIEQLKNTADLFSSFINAFHIEKVDINQLTASISRLSTLRDEAEKQGHILTQLQETVGRHEITLQQHEKKIGQLEEQMDQQKNKGPSSQQSQELDEASLQDYLIRVYKQYCEWENPVTADEKVIISHMYANPAVKLIREKDETRALVEVQKRLKEKQPIPLSYRQVFYTNTEQCENIYITGDAGMGKTAFCKQLIDMWCRVVQTTADDENLDDDLKVLKEFRFLFYVNLRDVESKYHIEDMIRENVLQSFTDLNAPGELEHVLKTKKCLVVLDGLDEWSCPKDVNICPGLNKELPGRDTIKKNCVYLTTSRNWKFDVVDLKTKDYDKHVELCGIDEKSLHEFAEKVIAHLKSSYQSESKRHLSDFFEELEEKKLDSVTNIPIIFTQLLTLWWHHKDLGKSQVRLYCAMLDLLFDRARKHLPKKTATVTKAEQTKIELPECFSEEDSCHNHAQLIFCLSQLAFMSLLNKKKESSLVFKSSKLEIYGIDDSDISLCLKCGILSQNKVLGNPTGRFKKYSFLHKKLQEFLAAVYLVIRRDEIDDNMRHLKKYCDKVDSTLEMEQVFMFACGMDADVGNQMLTHLMYVVSEDTRVLNSRRCRTGAHEELIKNIQSCVFGCLAEGASNDITYNVLLEDCWIERCNISDVVKYVVELKNISIKSVYLSTNKCTRELLSEVLNHLKAEIKTLEKLLIWDDNLAVEDGIVTGIVKNNVKSLKSLVLHNVGLGSDVLFTSVVSCIPSLHSLGLGQGLGLGFKTEELKKLEELEKLQKLKKNRKAAFPVTRVKHAQIEQLLSAPIEHLRQLQIQLYCIEHGG